MSSHHFQFSLYSIGVAIVRGNILRTPYFIRGYGLLMWSVVENEIYISYQWHINVQYKQNSIINNNIRYKYPKYERLPIISVDLM